MMASQKKRPAVGDIRWRVEWCHEAFWDEEGQFGDPDQDKHTVKTFATYGEAKAYAKEVFPKSERGYVEIDRIEFTMEDADLYPRGHWEMVGETEFYEGE